MSVKCQPPSYHPAFSQRNTATGTIIGPGAIDFFNPKCDCTIQWVTLQVASACTVQLLENGLPASLLLTVTTPQTAIRLPGRLLVNNAKLSLAISAGVSVTYEVIWIKQLFTDLVSYDFFFSLNSGGGSGGVTAFFGNTGDITALISGTDIVDVAGSGIAFSDDGLGDGTINIDAAPGSAGISIQGNIDPTQSVFSMLAGNGSLQLTNALLASSVPLQLIPGTGGPINLQAPATADAGLQTVNEPGFSCDLIGVVAQSSASYVNVNATDTLLAGAPAGYYIVICYAVCTAQTSGAPSIQPQLSYNDATGPNQEQVTNPIVFNGVQSNGSKVLSFLHTGGDIAFDAQWSPSIGSTTYQLTIILVRLS